ncbi:unnamed protein product [Aphanomyces euteiches]|nr:hypothetical protein AeRB84_016193 [Aphanomyces euteiches]
MARPSSLAIILGATVAFVTLAVVKLLWDDSSSKESSRGLTDESTEVTKTEETSSGVTKEKLVAYLREVAETVENLVAQLPELANLFMEESRANNQHIPEEQIRGVLVEKLGEAIRVAETSVAEKLKVTEDEIKAAVRDHHGEPEVQEAIQNFQRVIENSPLGESVEVPAEMTAELTLEVMSRVLDAVGRAMEEALEDAKKAGLRDVAADAHMWQDNYVQKSTAATIAIHNEYNVSEPILNASVAKYNQDPAFQVKLQTLVEKHQQNFQRLGL